MHGEMRVHEFHILIGLNLSTARVRITSSLIQYMVYLYIKRAGHGRRVHVVANGQQGVVAQWLYKENWQVIKPESFLSSLMPFQKNVDSKDNNNCVLIQHIF